MDISVQHILLFVIVVFILYHLIGRCGCNRNGFRVGGQKTCDPNKNQLCPAKIKGKEIPCPISGVCPTQEEVCIKAISDTCLDEINTDSIINKTKCPECINKYFDTLMESCDNDHNGLLSNLRDGDMCNKPCVGSNKQEQPLGPEPDPYAINDCNQLQFLPARNDGKGACTDISPGNKNPSHAYYPSGNPEKITPGNYNCIKDSSKCDSVICKCKKGLACFDWYDQPDI